jgi:hypothetical protein
MVNSIVLSEQINDQLPLLLFEQISISNQPSVKRSGRSLGLLEQYCSLIRNQPPASRTSLKTNQHQ